MLFSFSSTSVEQYSGVGKDFAIIFPPHWPKTSPSTPGPEYLQVFADSAPTPRSALLPATPKAPGYSGKDQGPVAQANYH